MLFGRFLMIVPIMALAGSLAQKKFSPPSAARSRRRRHFSDPAYRNGPVGRRAHFPPRPHPGARRRAFPHAGQKTFLTTASNDITKTWISLRPADCWPGHRRLVPETESRLMVKNPVMFVTMVGAALTTVGIFTAEPGLAASWRIAIWLWFTVLFANFAEAVAEGRGKAQAASLRRARKDTMARRLRNGAKSKFPHRIAERRSRCL